MQTIRFHSQADGEGKLQLHLDNLPANQTLEIVVVYQPIPPETTSPSYHQEEDPIVGLFSADSNLAEQSESFLAEEINNLSGWTWKSSQIQGSL